MVVGVLALQGGFAEHMAMLVRLNVDAREVRLPRDLKGVDRLILPGGESTTFGKVAVASGMIEPLTAFAGAGRPMWGTCAGLIFMAKDVGRDQVGLGLMDVTVRRNAFGRQVDSFTQDLKITGLRAPFKAVFIRAPLIEKVGKGVKVLSRLDDGTIVAARQGVFLGTSFHPELTDDPRMHALFLAL
jgi:5'-phosphate synthase pdxT subunit